MLKTQILKFIKISSCFILIKFFNIFSIHHLVALLHILMLLKGHPDLALQLNTFQQGLIIEVCIYYI